MEKEILEIKLNIALQALNDIANWDDDLEEEFDDPGYRAIEAIKNINSIQTPSR